MESITFLLLLTTIVLSAFRNIFSKKISSAAFGSRKFFLLQALIFLAGGTVVTLIGLPKSVSLQTVGLALCYALFLLLAQWFYTAALSKIKVSICSTVYSLGFIIPTLVGSLLWQESFSAFNIFGVLFALAAVIVSGIAPSDNGQKSEKRHFFLILVAMFSSGMLGVIQKIQQSIPNVSTEKEAFIAVAFFTAAIISFLSFSIAKSNADCPTQSNCVTAATTGAIFGICNLINTFLAGKLKSAVFFPVQNISVILISVMLGKLIFKEAFKKKELLVFSLGVCAIVFLSLF